MSRINWTHQERAAVAEEAKKVVTELGLTSPIGHADIIRVVALAQRTLPQDRQRHVSNMWRVQADLPFLRKAGIIEGRVGMSKAYRSLLQGKKEKRASTGKRVYRAKRRNVWLLNGTGLKVESGIRIPTQRVVSDLIAEMAPGDSILFDKKDRNRAEQSFRRVHGSGHFEGHVEGDKVRIWRTK